MLATLLLLSASCLGSAQSSDLPGLPAHMMAYGWYSFRMRGDVATLRLVTSRDPDFCNPDHPTDHAFMTVMDLWPQGEKIPDVRGRPYVPVTRGTYHVAPRGSDAEAGIIAGVIHDGEGHILPMRDGMVNLALYWGQTGDIFIFTELEVEAPSSSQEAPLRVAGSIGPKFCARVDSFPDPQPVQLD